MMLRKLSAIIVATVFLALTQQACGVAVDDSQDETPVESAVTAEAQEPLDELAADCTKNSDCLSDESCLGGKCRRLQQYPDP
ncbi:Hypothetical protein A7982_00757 [Minicystis rosea]|nr:Hypothetical protein A7982_00757 [Minicystis rosea]